MGTGEVRVGTEGGPRGDRERSAWEWGEVPVGMGEVHMGMGEVHMGMGRGPRGNGGGPCGVGGMGRGACGDGEKPHVNMQITIAGSPLLVWP